MKKIAFILLTVFFLSCSKEEFSESEKTGVKYDTSLASITYNDVELYPGEFSNNINYVTGEFKTYDSYESYYYYSYKTSFHLGSSYYRIQNDNLEIYLSQENDISEYQMNSGIYVDAVKIVIPKSELKANNRIFLSKSEYQTKKTLFAEFRYNKIVINGSQKYISPTSLITTVGIVKINEIHKDYIRCKLDIYYDEEFHIGGPVTLNKR